jgi:hypothetical protein
LDVIAKESLQPEWIHQLNKLKKTNYQPGGDGPVTRRAGKEYCGPRKDRFLSVWVCDKKVGA